ncbi:hypothetical protein FRC09_018090 [Ceratobasidium sp. 395]|nr:hypothetical protein FRC09_018090 [Ceratobasidium sp. 395]
MAASIAIRAIYGYKAESADDPFVKRAEESMVAFSDLRYLPTWFPFIRFHRHAQYVRHLKHAAETAPFEYVLKQMANNTAEESFTSKLLRTEEGHLVDQTTQDDVKNLAGGLYGAASDTTAAGIKSFFLAITLDPDAQTKAQEEIAAYTHGQRRMILPADRPNLPYTSALVRELLRWHPITGLVAHQTTQDDCNIVLEGKTHRIPAGSMVLANVWKMLHDPSVYLEPDLFKPERYLVENPPPGPESYAFGFGRRICPGIHVAQHSMWIAISNTLANFTISKAKDESGVQIVPEERYTTGVASHPLPFKCSTVPRDGCKEWLRELFE